MDGWMDAVVRTRFPVSPAVAHRSAHISDAAVHQGSADAQQHPAAHRRPAGQTSTVRLPRNT